MAYPIGSGGRQRPSGFWHPASSPEIPHRTKTSFLMIQRQRFACRHHASKREQPQTILRVHFDGGARCRTCLRCRLVVIEGHETDAFGSDGLRGPGDGAGFCGSRRAAPRDCPGDRSAQAHDRGNGEGNLHEEAVAGGESAGTKNLWHGRKVRFAGFRSWHSPSLGNAHHRRR